MGSTLTPLEFRAGQVDAGEGAALIAAMRDEIGRLYPGVDLSGPEMPAAGPAELSPPGGGFLVGWRDGAAVCCGGIKDLGGGACEIKRMYVVPEARGQGVARELLGALEALAREHGYVIARLDSGPEQPHAHALYRSAGYRDIDNFNGNPVATYFAEKPL